jgi:hypothetical protein
LALREQVSVYRVEGEIGRFRFRLYEAVDSAGQTVCQGSSYFPARQPREWHKTEGFREEALCLEASQRSYRTHAAHLNRYRRQPEGGTPVSTLQANAQQEGSQVLNFLERHSQSLLQAHGFDTQGQPRAAQVTQAAATTYHSLSGECIEQGLTVVCQVMQARGFSPEQITSVRTQATGAVYEDPLHCTNVAIDDIEVKKQKAHRESPLAPGSEPPVPETFSPTGRRRSGKRPKVSNTVARIDQGQKHFTLSGSGVGQVLRFVLAFLLNNDLLNGRVHFFTDGYKSLQNTIVAFFAWHPGVGLLLDWYHLVKKFKEDLSLACRGRALRNQHLRPLLRLLWYGLVEDTRRYLAAIPTEDLKDTAPITRLQSYLDRNEGSIPCYALRSQLGLRNASSPVESANNEVTARRQKRHGMSWSKPGSHALTALSVLVRNRCHERWVREHTLLLEFVDEAA